MSERRDFSKFELQVAIYAICKFMQFANLPLAMNSLVVRNNDIHHYNTRQNHHLRGSRPTCKTVVNSFTNRSFHIWNAISSQVNINVSLYKFKYNVKLFLLENDLMITYHY